MASSPQSWFRICSNSSDFLDTANAWEPKPDGSFVRLHPPGVEEPLDSQAHLLEDGF